MISSVPIMATDDDHEYAWRHAFAYADCYATTTHAIEYANHYRALIASEDDLHY